MQEIHTKGNLQRPLSPIRWDDEYVASLDTARGLLHLQVGNEILQGKERK